VQHLLANSLDLALAEVVQQSHTMTLLFNPEKGCAQDVTPMASEPLTQGRLAKSLSHQILRHIGQHNLQPGDKLGSEAELVAMFGISRSVLREAIRPLERLGIVDMRRTKNQSGLTVAAPRPDAIVRSAAIYLSQSNPSPAHVRAILKALEQAIIREATGLDSDSRLARSTLARQALRWPSNGGPESLATLLGNFYTCFSDLTSNPVIALFMKILSRTLLLDPLTGDQRDDA